MKKWLGSLVFIAACSTQPVMRDTGAAPSPSPVAAGKLATGTGEGGLHKRIWILRFDAKNATPPKELKDVDVQGSLQRSLMDAFSSPSSPFIAEAKDSNGLQDLNVDSSSPTPDLIKMARGSGAGAYLRGEITQVSLSDNDASSEGLLRSLTTELKVTVNFELDDGLTGRKIYNGTAFDSVTDTTQRFLISEKEATDFGKKIDQITQSLADKIVQKLAPLADRLGWEGRVVRVDGPRIFINTGRRTGIEIGDTLRVIEVSKTIIDPQNGSVVGDAPGRVKATLKVTQHFGLDGSVSVLIMGGGVVAGDRVELSGSTSAP